MMGIELQKWPVYSEPAHLSVSTPPEHSPDAARVAEMNRQMGLDMVTTMMEVRENPRPGLVNALLQLRIDGEPAPDLEILGNLGLIIGGGLRHHNRPDRSFTGMAERASRRAGTAQPRKGRAAGPPRHRGVPAVLHPPRAR